MKLNHRDRVLITILFVAAVWAVGIFVFIVPAFQELGEKKDELNNLQVKLSELKDQIEKDKDLPQRIQEEYAKSEELAKNFYEYQPTQQAADTLDKLLDAQHIVNTDLKISDYSLTSLKPFKYTSNRTFSDFDKTVQDYEAIGASSVVDPTAKDRAVRTGTLNDGSQFSVDPQMGVSVGSYQMNFKFRGVYKDLQKFCEELTKSVPGSLIISSLNITDVNGIKEEDKKEGEESSSKAESKAEGKEGEEDSVDNNEIEGEVTIDIIVILKMSTPEF